MEPLPFIRVKTAEGATILNLANVAAVIIDDNGSFGVKRSVTVHLSGGATLDFTDEYGDDLVNELTRLDQAGLLTAKASRR